MLKSYKKNYKRKEGFAIGDNTNLTQDALHNNTDNYQSNLTSIIGQLQNELEITSPDKQSKYAEILKSQSQLIKLVLLKKMLSFNLNLSDDYLLMINQQVLGAFNTTHNQTGADFILSEVIDAGGASNTAAPSSSGGVFTQMFGLS